MGGSKDDRTLKSGGADPEKPAAAAGAADDAPQASGEVPADGAGQPKWAWVSRSEAWGAVFGETERFAERELLGIGGMSTVVRAFDKDLRRDVAIKVLPPEMSQNNADVERFTAEARITGQLEHPYVVPVYEFGADPRGGRFLCMKLVQGKTLEETLHKDGIGRLETDRLADLLQIFVKVCEAVSFAHSRGIIHRDLKPSNIMISDFGQVYVLDWGVARWDSVVDSSGVRVDLGKRDDANANREAPGMLVGTPCYMAPEQLWGLHDEIDDRTDVFALGATLYQILTGQPPRLSESIRFILMGKPRFEIPPPEEVVEGAIVPAELSRIALKAMSHEPADRYPSVKELKTEVERFLRGSWHLPREQFAAGSIIVCEGEPGESAYIIVEGRCVVFCNEEDGENVLREMGPGEVFGETAIFLKKPRTASVRAATNVVVMVVTSDTLSSALGLNFWMGSFVKALAERFREVDERLRQMEQEGRRRSLPPT